jgi:hypothetical protein
MNAIVTEVRPYVDFGGSAHIRFDVLYYGTPLPATRSVQATLQIDLIAADSTNTLAAKINAAVDVEARLVTASEPGGAVTPTTTFAPSYIKLR